MRFHAHILSFFVKLNKKGFKSLSQNTKNMAQVEGLEAHKLSVQIREE